MIKKNLIWFPFTYFNKIIQRYEGHHIYITFDYFDNEKKICVNLLKKIIDIKITY